MEHYGLKVMTAKDVRQMKSRVLNYDFTSGLYKKKPIMTCEERMAYLTRQRDVSAIWYIAGLNAKAGVSLSIASSLVAMATATAATTASIPTWGRVAYGVGAGAYAALAWHFNRVRKQARSDQNQGNQLLENLEKGENIPTLKFSLMNYDWFFRQRMSLSARFVSAFGQWHIFGRSKYTQWQREHISG